MKRWLILLGFLLIFHQNAGFGIGFRVDEPGTTVVVFPENWSKDLKEQDTRVITIMSNGTCSKINWTTYEARYRMDSDVLPDLVIMQTKEVERLIGE